MVKLTAWLLSSAIPPPPNAPLFPVTLLPELITMLPDPSAAMPPPMKAKLLLIGLLLSVRGQLKLPFKLPMKMPPPRLCASFKVTTMSVSARLGFPLAAMPPPLSVAEPENFVEPLVMMGPCMVTHIAGVGGADLELGCEEEDVSLLAASAQH